MSNMDRGESKRDWKIKKIPGDGNCLFNALLDQIKEQGLTEYSNWNHLTLRNKVSNHIKNNLSSYMPQIIANMNEIDIRERYSKIGVQEGIQQYIEDIKRNGFWGGAETIRATCDIVGARTIVYQEEGKEIIFTPHNLPHSITLKILYTKATQNDRVNNHYDSIQQVEKEKPVPKRDQMLDRARNSKSIHANELYLAHYPNRSLIANGNVVEQDDRETLATQKIIDKVRIGTWNVRGCSSIEKRKIICEALKNQNISIACLQETHLITGFYQIGSFDWHLSGGDKNRTYRGVAILVSNNVRMTKFIHYSENIALGEIYIKEEAMIIITCHMPCETKVKNSDDFTILSQIITEFSKKKIAMIIAGDFNAHIGSNLNKTERCLIGPQLKHNESNVNRDELRNLITLHKLNLCTSWRKCKSVLTTWTNGKAESQIDHILSVNTYPKFTMWCKAKWETIVNTDHKLVFAIITDKREYKKTGTRTSGTKSDTRSMKWYVEGLKNIDKKKEYQKQIKETLEQSLSKTTQEETGGDEWERLSGIITEVAGKTLNKPRSPMTPRRRKALAAQQKARFRKSHLPQSARIDEELKKANLSRNEVFKQHELEKCEKFFGSIHTWHPMQRMRLVYKYIKKHKSMKKTRKLYIPMSKWEEVANKGEEGPRIELIQETDNYTITPAPTAEKICDMIQEFKKGTAPGADRINIELLQEGPTELTIELAKIIANTWNNNTIPESWIYTIQVPIPKIPTPKGVDDFRRITLCSVTYKIYAKWLLEKLDEMTQPIPQYQTAFINNRSTDDHIFTIRRIAEEAWREGRTIYILALDLAKAFDTVNHKALISILKDYGVPHFLINRIIKACIHEKSSIQWYGQYTQYRNKLVGVKQGCPISPRLFTIVLHEVLRKTVKAIPQFNIELDTRLTIPTILAYADDLIVIADNLKDLEELLKEISPNLQAAGMNLNLDKSEMMIRNPNSKDESLDTKDGTIMLNNNRIKLVQSLRYLGSHITNRINRKGNIRPRILKAMNAARAILPFLQKYSPPWPIIRTMYNSLITPIAIYGLKATALTKTNRNSLRKMEKYILSHMAQ